MDDDEPEKAAAPAILVAVQMEAEADAILPTRWVTAGSHHRIELAFGVAPNRT